MNEKGKGESEEWKVRYGGIRKEKGMQIQQNQQFVYVTKLSRFSIP